MAHMQARVSVPHPSRGEARSRGHAFFGFVLALMYHNLNSLEGVIYGIDMGSTMGLLRVILGV